jgi:hypothetical protein
MMISDGVLAPLLSRLLIAFTIEFDNEFEHHMPHRTQLLGVLPAIGADAVRLRDLPLRAGVSKEAVSAATGFPDGC